MNNIDSYIKHCSDKYDSNFSLPVSLIKRLNPNFVKLKNLTLKAASSKSEYTKIKKLTPKDAARKPLKSHRVLNILAAT